MAVLANWQYDVVVIGGGIKGCAITRDAVGRGLRVLLCEKDDLGSGYVKNIVRYGLNKCGANPTFNRTEVMLAHREWEILRRTVPHLSKMPNELANATRYKFFSCLPTSGQTAETPLRSGMTDHRFVMLNARDAAERGATILPHTSFLGATRLDGRWAVRIRSANTTQIKTISAFVIVDTAGIFSGSQDLAENPEHGNSGYTTAAILCEGESDRSIVTMPIEPDGLFFSVAFEPGLRLVGYQFQSEKTLDPKALKARLIEAARAHDGASDVAPEFQWFGWVEGQTSPHSASPDAKFSDYDISINALDGQLPVIRVQGGSISAARKIAEDVVAEMAPYANMIGKQWTRTTPLPGGDFQIGLRDTLIAQLRNKYTFLTGAQARRLFGDHGTDAARILLGVAEKCDLGRDFGEGLFEKEVRWLFEKEWAQTAEDIVWRRTRLGMRLTPEQVGLLETWVNDAIRAN